MTWRYAFGFPGNLDEFVDYVQRKELPEVILYHQNYTQEDISKSRANGDFVVDRVIVDNGLRRLRHRSVIIYDNSFSRNHPLFGDAGKKREIMIAKERALETFSRYKIPVKNLGMVGRRVMW